MLGGRVREKAGAVVHVKTLSVFSQNRSTVTFRIPERQYRL